MVDFRNVCPPYRNLKATPNFGKDGAEARKLIIFIIGGITWSEIRSAYEVMRDFETAQGENPVKIFVGSTHIVTPMAFINDLAAL